MTCCGKHQTLGYAEADPMLDIEGIDAAQKLTLLTALAYGFNIPLQEVYTEGITKITQKEIQHAQELGYVIKLLAIAKRNKGKIEARCIRQWCPCEVCWQMLAARSIQSA